LDDTSSGAIQQNYIMIISPGQLNESLLIFVNALIEHYEFAGYCLLDLYNLGFRYNELYHRENISEEDPDHWRIKTEKGSNDRIVLKSDFTTFFNNNLTNEYTSFVHCRITTMQRLFDRWYQYKNTMVQTKPIKTHLFRHNRIKQMNFQGMSEQEIADWFGELDIQNIHNYIISEITGE
jgi:hypothetical protein